MSARFIGRRACLAAFCFTSFVAASATAQVAVHYVDIKSSQDQSSIYRRDTGIDDSGEYKREVQACKSGRAQQARETCLIEARNAHAALQRGELTRQIDNFRANALMRCEPRAGEYKAACRARESKTSQTVVLTPSDLM